MTKIGTVFLFLIALLFVFSINNKVFSLFLFIFLFFLFQFDGFFLKKLIQHSLNKRIVTFLTKILLKMRIGTSFRESFLQSLSGESGLFKRIMLNIYESVVFSQQIKSFRLNKHDEIAYELIKIDQQSLNKIGRLEKLLEKYKIEQVFRRKSGQVLAQIRIQSLFLAGTYFALLIFMILNYPIVKISKYLMMSLPLYFLGLLISLVVQKRFKWKL